MIFKRKKYGFKNHKYLYYRDLDINGISNFDRAVRFIYITQLAFSGMRRFNSSGKFNVPFGHYKRFNPDITKDHVDLINSTKIFNENATNIIKMYDKEDIFIFLDPPYTRVFNKYSANNSFGEEQQLKLSMSFKNLKKAKCMIIIDSSDLTKKLYKDYIRDVYDLKYGVNIKNRFKTDVKHLIITNYNVDKKEPHKKFKYDEALF